MILFSFLIFLSAMTVIGLLAAKKSQKTSSDYILAD
jgi:Na+/proline symporter